MAETKLKGVMRMRGKSKAATLAVVLSLVVVVPAFAGWRLTWQPSGAISLRVVKISGQDVLAGIVNPTTGEGRSGNLELRLSGVVCKQFLKPPYYFEIPIEQPVLPDPDLRGKIEGQENVAPIMLNDGLDHVFEAWFTVRDQKGRIIRGKQAAPTVSFRLDPLAIDPAVAAAAIEQRLNATIEALNQQMAKQREEYEAALKKFEAEKKAQQERYEAGLKKAREEEGVARKVTLLVDGQETTTNLVVINTTDQPALVEVKGADRYLVYAEGKEHSFVKEAISIRFNKGISSQLRLFAFIGNSATEYQVTAKGASG